MSTLGEFRIVSGEVFITDPCYDKTTWCQAKLDNDDDYDDEDNEDIEYMSHDVRRERLSPTKRKYGETQNEDDG